jgi:hypothetical protein
MLHVANITYSSAAFLGLALAACGDTRQNEMTRAAPIESAATAPPARPFRPGIRFDPGAIRPGTRVGELVAESLVVRRSDIDSTFVGEARFRGRIQVSGWTLRNPDADLANVASCFEADSASASRMPRWAGDERRPWFCFVNRTDAERALGPPSEGVPATIVIDSFTIHCGFSDEVNSARFVGRVREGNGASAPAD